MTSRTPRTRRKWVAALAVAAIIPMLAACAGNAKADGSAGTVDGSTIVLQTVNSLQPQFQKYADAYMKKYPKRKVEVRASTDDGAKYAQQLATARISGQLPDVFFNVDYLADTLAKANVPLDLASGIKDGKLGSLRIKDFAAPFVGQYRPISNPDEVTGLPVSADSVGLYWNKTLFDKYGVTEYPKADWTWDDMLRVAKEIQDKSGGKVYGLGSPLQDGSNQLVFGPVLRAFGADVYNGKTGKSDIGSPDAIKAWKLLISAYGTSSNPYSANANDPALAFSAGNVAMGIGSRAAIPGTQAALKDEWNVQSMPTINGKSTAGGGSYGLSISQTSKQQDAAWAFLKWFYSDAGMAVAQKVGGVIPPTNDGIDNGSWKDTGGKPPANIAIFGHSARTAVLLTQMPGSSGTVLTQATVKATQEVVLQHVSVEKAFQQAQDTVNAQLAKDFKKK
ncbi:sugar ABC transporter substrate-binding protein [Humibacter sp. RRB41]|uniref:ABC transporter substrate-binding protein n=1 Tax=Humibacter sp. RRB41 TaxID=2919946 RepID=UPI001FA9C006|nr:sugar ABC transporter substrate-binding protein [Humibacter sp. RRB41]